MAASSRESNTKALTTQIGITILFIGFSSLSACGGDEEWPNLEVAPTADVTVSADGAAPLSSAVSAGVFACWVTDDETWREIVLPRLLRSRPSNIRLCQCSPPAIDMLTPPAPDDANYQATRQCISDQVSGVRPLLDAGWTLSTHFASMPRWLSIRPDNESSAPNGDWFFAWNLSPPADWSAWSDLVRWYAQAYADEGVHPYYGVWDEPDWMLMGTVADYLQLYEATSVAIKEADPMAKVGGTNSANFYHKKIIYDEQWNVIGQSTEPLINHLVKHVAATPAPSLGLSHLPLDFIDFHFPSPAGLPEIVEDVRGLMAGSGLEPDVPVRIGEWTHHPDGPEASSESSAAYAAAMLFSFANASDGNEILHDQTSLYDQAGWSDGGWSHVGFVSAFNELTRPWGVVRPKLNFYEMLGLLAETRLCLRISGDDASMRGLATSRADGSLGIVLTRSSWFTLADAIWSKSERRLVADGAFTREEMDSIELQLDGCAEENQNVLQQLLQLQDPIVAADMIGVCIPDLAEEKRLTLAETLLDVQVELKTKAANAWSGTVALPWNGGHAQITSYRIDEAHASACGYNRRTSTVVTDARPCGADGAIDKMWDEAVRLSLDEASNFLVTLGWTTTQAELAHQIATDCFRFGYERTNDIISCVTGGLAQHAAELPLTANEDVQQALTVATTSLSIRESTLRHQLNAMPEVSLTAENMGTVQAKDGWIALSVTIPSEGTILLDVK